MATYDYKCNDCEHIQEEKHSMKETPIIQCVKCKSTNTQKVIMTAARHTWKEWT